ncbi:MAG: GNAT family N-acetyltransferase [Spirochaetes bacterium]|nr:GNAT family N-acetyltransferase [Spirochaetota bacterium]
MRLNLERANFIDANELTNICFNSFNQEMILYKDGKHGGPQHYDDPNWHIYSMKEGVYHKILLDNKLVGAIIIALRGRIKNNTLYHWELVQVYIDNEYKHKGIGTFAIKQIEKWFPEMYKLTTCTPSFSVNNIEFYKKLGFNEIDKIYCHEEDIEIILFEKLYKNSI